MNFSRIYLNRLQHLPEHPDAVVVIDVLRSFTTAAVALAGGAACVRPVEGGAAAIAVAERLPDAVTVGAVAGGDPAPGFAYGNAPAELLGIDLAGRQVVMSTAAGVRGLQRFVHAPALYAASLVCARATAALIRQAGAQEVCFVITGEWVDRDGDEDVACADYIEALLRGSQPDPTVYARRVRESDFGRRFLSGEWPNLPLADLTLAAEVDRYAFAMPVTRDDEGMLIRPVRVT
ncbi:2-phosphosulfolactate phosphatase [Dechloromonas sp. ZS-1]|uniref:2-phosphosulfolactate phosphatase n=1 Tax=Dechloromonas sp. ZS-1 TaxID=3138067 RepID=UPI0031FD7F7F